MNQPITFLHLSDIHFSKRSGSTYDPDLDVRRQLVADAVKMLESVKVCSGILVSGDIAYSGKVDEYNTARDWLRELCRQLKCPEESIWTIPGNHDVDRDVVRKSGSIQDKHKILRQGDLENEIKRLHEDVEAFEAIHRPFAAYLKFAGGCTPKPGHLYWEDDVPLNDGSLLRIRGCNSALVSGGEKKDDENDNRLVVGQQQMLPAEDPGVTNLLMCHHPLDWLHDRDALRDSLKARTRVALFGHKHIQRVERVDDTLLVMAGAVHPDRSEKGWQPRYNYLALSVGEQAGKRHLAVALWPRIWDDVDKVFKPEFDKNGSDRRSFELPLPDWKPPPTIAAVPDNLGMTTEVTKEGNIVNPKRRLVYRFHSLPYIRRMEIVTKLKLIEDQDQDLKEEERYPLYFRRAAEKGVLDQLWIAIEQQHGIDLPGANPFAKKT